MGCSKTRAMVNASGKLGSYLPVSIAFTVWRETLSRVASSACDHSRSARKTRRRFFMRPSLPPETIHEIRSSRPSLDTSRQRNRIVCYGKSLRSVCSSVPPYRKHIGASPQKHHVGTRIIPLWPVPCEFQANKDQREHQGQQEGNGERFKADALLQLVHF
jgi:hypothetical protein